MGKNTAMLALTILLVIVADKTFGISDKVVTAARG